MIFVDGHVLRLAVDRGRAAKDYVLGAGGFHSTQKIHAAGDVVVEIFAWVAHAFSHADVAGEENYGFDITLREKCMQTGSIPYVNLFEIAVADSRAPPILKVVGNKVLNAF